MIELDLNGKGLKVRFKIAVFPIFVQETKHFLKIAMRKKSSNACVAIKMCNEFTINFVNQCSGKQPNFFLVFHCKSRMLARIDGH